MIGRTALKEASVLALDGVAMNAAAAARTFYLDCKRHSYLDLHVNLYGASGAATNLVATVYVSLQDAKPTSISDWVITPVQNPSATAITVTDGPLKFATGGSAGILMARANLGGAARCKVVISAEGVPTGDDLVDVYACLYTP